MLKLDFAKIFLLFSPATCHSPLQQPVIAQLWSPSPRRCLLLAPVPTYLRNPPPVLATPLTATHLLLTWPASCSCDPPPALVTSLMRCLPPAYMTCRQCWGHLSPCHLPPAHAIGLQHWRHLVPPASYLRDLLLTLGPPLTAPPAFCLPTSVRDPLSMLGTPLTVPPTCCLRKSPLTLSIETSICKLILHN